MAMPQMTTETTAFNMATPKCPVFINSMFSKLKVENVLKPPQKPVAARSIILLSISPFRLNLTRDANIMQASRLLMKVAKGKCVKSFEINRLIP